MKYWFEKYSDLNDIDSIDELVMEIRDAAYKDVRTFGVDTHTIKHKYVEYYAGTFEEVITPIRALFPYPGEIRVRPIVRPSYEGVQMPPEYSVDIAIDVSMITIDLLKKLNEIPEELRDSIVLSHFYWENPAYAPYERINIVGHEDSKYTRDLTCDGVAVPGVCGYSAVTYETVVDFLNKHGAEIKPGANIDQIISIISGLYPDMDKSQSEMNASMPKMTKALCEVYTVLRIYKHIGNTNTLQTVQEYVSSTASQGAAKAMQLF